MAIGFNSQIALTGVVNLTSLQFGSAGRLYVSQQDGFINTYTVSVGGTGERQALLQESIALLQDIPKNH